MIGKTNSVSGTQVSGSLSITSNGTYDVTEYASAVVNVPSTVEGKLDLVVMDDTEYELTANDTQNWTSIKMDAFCGSKKLTSIMANNVTSIGGSAFYGCARLSTISLPSVTSIGGSAFYQCARLSTISLPSVTSIGQYVFGDCTNLTSIDLPLVTSVGANAFYQCTSLTSIDLPSVTSIGVCAFCVCINLKTMYLRANRVCTLSNTNAFNSIPRFTIYVPSNLVSSYETATNWSTLVANNQVTFAAITE